MEDNYKKIRKANILKCELLTDIKEELITQEVRYIEGDIIKHSIRSVFDAGDKQLQDALIKLGWTPPAIKIKEIKDAKEEEDIFC